ncbi:MAG: hypothetical protein ACRETW_08805 [Stenotrophobium sp.]
MDPAAPQEPTSETATGAAGFLACAVRAAQAAQMQISVLSVNLDRRIYGSEEFIAPVTAFLLRHERARLRVLLCAPDITMKSGHRLVELGRRLSSRIEFRELLPERRASERELLIVDESAVLLRESVLDVDARYWLQAPLLARERLREFETMWQESPPASELRSLGL